MSKSYTQQIIEHYVPNDSNLESDITKLLATLKRHNLLNDDIDISDEKDILISGLQNLPVYEKNSKKKIAYQTYRLLLTAIKDITYIYESDQIDENHVIQPQVQVQVQPQPVSDFEEPIKSRPRAQSFAPSYICSRFTSSKKKFDLDRLYLVAIETTFEDIEARVKYNHEQILKINKSPYNNALELACTNWQMRALGIIDDELLQNLIIKKKKTMKGCSEGGSRKILRNYTKLKNIGFLPIAIDELVAFIRSLVYDNLAIPIDVTYEGGNILHSIILIKKKRNIYIYDPSSYDNRILWQTSSEQSLLDKFNELHISPEVKTCFSQDCYNNETTKLSDVDFGGQIKKSRKNNRTKGRCRKTKRRRKRSNRRR